MLNKVVKEITQLVLMVMLSVMYGIGVILSMQVFALFASYKLDPAIPFWSAIIVSVFLAVGTVVNYNFDHGEE